MTQEEGAAFWHLTHAGFRLNDDGTWTGPFTGKAITDADRDAAQRLTEAHDFGRIIPLT